MLHKILMLFFFCLLAEEILGAAVPFRVKKDEGSQAEEVCQTNIPCGWAIYMKGTRNLDYFMKNKCTCGPEDQCVRTEDDISQYAFVYRCRPKTKVRTADQS